MKNPLLANRRESRSNQRLRIALNHSKKMSQAKYKPGDVVGRWFIKRVEKYHRGEWLYAITSMNSLLGFGGIPESELESSPSVSETRYTADQVAAHLTAHNLWN
jgi:hypothetical protein